MQGRFDGMTVDINEGKFGGSFDIPEENADDVSYDTTFVFVVTGIAGKSTFDTTKQGDVKRTTQFDLHDVVVLSAEEAEQILNEMHGGGRVDAAQIPGQLSHDDYSDEGDLIDVFDDDDDEVFAPSGGIRQVGSISQSSDDVLNSFLDQVG